MTRVLITGAAGFLGRRLTDALLYAGQIGGAPISELILADLVAPPEPAKMTNTIKLTNKIGDLSDSAFLEDLYATGFDSLFHLASFLTIQAESDPSRAYLVNVESLRRLLDQASNCPRVIFTSSIAIHGGALPDMVDDTRNPIPATTYGTHKAVNELLIADYSRLGRIDGRSLRLPIVVTRPGAPTPAVSDRIAAILREPLRGRDQVAPLSPDTIVPLVSAGAVVRALIATHDAPAEALPPKRAFNLPSLSVTIAQMAEAAARGGGTGRVTFQPDPQIEKIVASWPQQFVSDHAARLDVRCDKDIDALVQDYLTHEGR